MVEADHQRGDIDLVGHPLVVAPGFAKAVGAIVALEANGPAPGLDHVVDGGNRQGPAAFPAFKQGLAGVADLPGDEVGDGGHAGAVQRQPARFAGFLFVYFNGVAGGDIADLVDAKAQKIACPKVRVDPQGKKAKLPRPVLEHAADQLDVLEVADGIHLDLLPLFGRCAKIPKFVKVWASNTSLAAMAISTTAGKKAAQAIWDRSTRNKAMAIGIEVCSRKIAEDKESIVRPANVSQFNS